MKKFILATLLSLCFVSSASAQELVADQMTTYKAEVLQVLSQENKNIPGTNTPAVFQSLRATILSGDLKGTVVTVENNYLKLEKGDVFYLTHTVRAEDGHSFYFVSDAYRLPWLLGLVVVFIFLVFIFGGIQGVRGLASLAGSLVLILYVLIPQILQGASPLLVSLGVSALIIIVGSYITHGFNKTTSSAVVGMIATVLITGVLAYLAVHGAKLTGYGAEEAIYLNLDSGGSIDVLGLLFGGIMIGLLGVLYDVAIGQAVSVEELHAVGPHLPKKFIYKRAIRIGREHIGALVNTLVIAYVGVSLPLLLLFSMSGNTQAFSVMINQEIFATEIVRTMIGSIGLVLAVPITTLIAVFIVMRHSKEGSPELVRAESEKVEHVGHHH